MEIICNDYRDNKERKPFEYMAYADSVAEKLETVPYDPEHTIFWDGYKATITELCNSIITEFKNKEMDSIAIQSELSEMICATEYAVKQNDDSSAYMAYLGGRCLAIMNAIYLLEPFTSKGE